MNYEIIKNLIDNNRYNEALAKLDILIAQNPNDDEAYYIKGKVYQRLSQWGNAIKTYNKAIELNPESKAVTALDMLYDILKSINNNIIST